MKIKIVFGVTTLAAVLTVAGWLLHQSTPPGPSPVIPAKNPEAAPQKVQPVETALVVVTQEPAASNKISDAVSVKKSAQKNNPAAPKEPLHDPDARVALSLVGSDPDAEAYWLSAIFDTNLPDKEREDLMEDLNEDGLSDPKHPGPDDIPLIMNRIALIEEIAPNADPFMSEHLAEAYKDLNNLLAGKPPQ